ncbi:MAG: DUF302 domain-containing protein, partial [Chromatiales bacterium]|nr:DUF302 domain-containing protein [Chromatiales bacterium]
MKLLPYLLTACLVTLALPATALEPVTPPEAPIVVYKVESGFSETKEFLEMAITDQGMSVSDTLHISDMLERTAKDTGLDRKLYGKAESLEFCSIAMSYKMSEAHPA